MKRSFGILIIASAFVVACNSQTAKNGDNSDKILSEKSTENLAVASVKSDTPSEYSDKPIHLNKQEFLAKVMNYEKNPNEWIYEGNLPCLIDFYADWCGPCRLTAPILEDLAKEYAGKIYIYKIDVQREPELANVFGVQGIPAFLYCPAEGNPTMASGIARSLDETKNMFRQNIDNLLLKNNQSSNTIN